MNSYKAAKTGGISGKSDYSHAEIRRSAADILAGDGNRLKIAIAVSVSLLFYALPMIIMNMLWNPVVYILISLGIGEGVAHVAAEFLYYLLPAAAVIPAFLGILMLAENMLRVGQPFTAVFLGGYVKIMKSLAVSIICAVPAMMAAAVYFLLDAVLHMLDSADFTGSFAGLAALMYAAVFVLAAIIVVLAVIFSLRGFFFAGLAMRGDMGVTDALAASFRLSRGRMRQTVAFIFGFSGWAVLSLLSIGILFIIQLVPLFSVSYMIYCGRAADEGEIRLYV